MKPDLKISRAVTKLAFNQPFFGSCLMQLRLEEKAEIPTMCTDSKHIWWNAKFVEELSEEEVQFVLAHEVMHVLLKHCKPHLGKDPKLCNVAMDYVINAQLRDCGFSIVKGALLDPTFSFDNLSWEEVYNKLEGIKNNKPDPSLSESDINKLKRDIENAEEHFAPSSAKTATQIEEENNRIDEMLVRAANLGESSGNIPSELKNCVKALKEAKIPWREELEIHIKSRYPEDFTFAKPNRRHMGSGLYLPTLNSEQAGTLVIAVDTSGSVSELQLTSFVNEINYIINEVNPLKVYLMSSDTRVANVKEYDSDHYFENFDAVGGGGTSFIPVFEYISDNSIEVDQMLYFSDMYVGPHDFPKTTPDYPVTWVSTGSTNNPPFGKLIKLEI